jgi:hypothetical protein
MVIEGTVLSVELTPNLHSFIGEILGPADFGSVRIDRIIETINPDNGSIPPEFAVGKNVDLEFGYGLRKAVVRTIPGMETVSGDLVSYSCPGQEFRIENETPVYVGCFSVVTGTEEETLPGLNVGESFRARVTVGFWGSGNAEGSLDLYTKK